MNMFTLHELQHALDHGEFFLEYLPTIALADGRCVGGESLIRWQRADEVIYPLEFIPLAENTWLSGRITYWVVETVSHELRSWLMKRTGLHISINVPPEIIGRGGLTYAAHTSRLDDVLDKIMFEVTERGLLDELGVAGLNVALEQGQQVALDDIGTNDASLLVLSRVGTGTVKLDKSFADEMLQPDWTADKIAGIAALIRRGKLRVIAEGVESRRQRDILAEAGVQMAQGFYFARPMRAKQFTAFCDRVNGAAHRGTPGG
jgi:sensor c-di-GMP phosphodiesterase-like protein